MSVLPEKLRHIVVEGPIGAGKTSLARRIAQVANAALISWSIALFEYLLQVPANRIGFTALNLSQLKIMQEVITLAVFIPFAVIFMKQPIKLDFLWAGLCMMGAVYFVLRN